MYFGPFQSIWDGSRGPKWTNMGRKIEHIKLHFLQVRLILSENDVWTWEIGLGWVWGPEVDQIGGKNRYFEATIF